MEFNWPILRHRAVVVTTKWDAIVGPRLINVWLHCRFVQWQK